jgi:Transposase IS4
LRTHFEYAFYDCDVSILSNVEYYEAYHTVHDPWYRINQLVKEFNENQSNMILSTTLKVCDESMSQWHPRATQLGKLPHISYIARRPKPLGTEFKVVADRMIGCMLHIEIQKGKETMQQPSFARNMEVPLPVP